MAMTPFYANKREDEKCLHTKNYHLISNVEYLIFRIHSQTETDSQIYWSEWSLTSDFKKNVVSIWTSEFSNDLYRLLGISLYGREKNSINARKDLINIHLNSVWLLLLSLFCSKIGIIWEFVVNVLIYLLNLKRFCGF